MSNFPDNVHQLQPDCGMFCTGTFSESRKQALIMMDLASDAAPAASQMRVQTASVREQVVMEMRC